MPRTGTAVVVLGLVLWTVLAIPLVVKAQEGDGNSEIQALPGFQPEVDGFPEDDWEDAGSIESSFSDGTRFELRALIKGDYLYCLVYVKLDSHDDEEYVALLGTNSSKKTSAADFGDLKRVNRDNTTGDFHVVGESGWNLDSDQNVTGRVALYPNPEQHNWTVYEFYLPLASNDSEDVKWTVGGEYAAKVAYGSGGATDLSGMKTSDHFTFKVGAQSGEGNVELGEFKFDWNVFVYVIFGLVFAFYGIVGLYVFQSRVKVGRRRAKTEGG
ncbi:MAG: hypothetical protein Kow0069_29790 [Promethearchaeota archaeon]